MQFASLISSLINIISLDVTSLSRSVNIFIYHSDNQLINQSIDQSTHGMYQFMYVCKYVHLYIYISIYKNVIT